MSTHKVDVDDISAAATTSSSGSDSEEDASSPTLGTSSNTGLRHRRCTQDNASSDDSKKATAKIGKKKTITTVDPSGKPYTLARWIEFAIGCVIFFSALPLVAVQIVSCTLWEFIDQATFKLTDLGTRLNIQMDPYFKWLVQHPKDTFIVNTTIWLGGVLPAYFFWEAYTQYQSLREGNGFIWWRAALYNIVRIGPMYRHFMYVYVLCHKEAHSYGKLFAEPYRTYTPLGWVYNYFIGFFHGVLPGPFTESHIYNHHKYDNSIDDVYSTGAYPRDSFKQFLRYVYVWFLYALNISSIIKFAQEGKTERVWRSIGGTIYYFLGVRLAWKLVGPQFAIFYVLYPLVEGNILLSAVNYTWHSFIDPNDHDNDYVNSVTILDGLNFTLDEEYHVVHHQYAGVHWSRNKEFYYKHIEEYKNCTATVFKECNLFVIWGMIVAKDYEGLTDHFVQLDDDKSKHLSKTELAQLLKERLQCTSWSY